MLVVSGAIARPTTLSQRYRPRRLLPRNSAPKHLDPRNQSKLTAKPLLCAAPMNSSSLIARKRRKSIKKRSKTRKTLLQPLETAPLRVKKLTGSATITRKKATLWGTFRNLQKTSVGLDNLRAGNWWWWKCCQGTLHLLFGLIPRKSRTRRLIAGKNFAW